MPYALAELLGKMEDMLPVYVVTQMGREYGLALVGGCGEDG